MKQGQIKKWFSITQADNIPLREGRSVQVAGHTIAIFNLGDRFLAVENNCPHRGGPLSDGIVSGRTVVCPLHAWKIDLESGQVTGRPEGPLCVKTFATALRDGVVMLELSVSENPVAVQPACAVATHEPFSTVAAGD